jgi:conjugative transfer pilus assembly protein TraH
LVGEFNLAWKVMEKMDISFEDSETNLNPFGEEGLSAEENQTLKEIFMTVSGTIIHRRGRDGHDEHITLRGKGDQEGFLSALMSGGRIRYYKCDTPDRRCLYPTETELVLAKDKSLHIKIQTALIDLVAKIQNDDGEQEATAAQKAIINVSTLPIYKIINVTTAFQKGRAPISIQEYSELIAFDVLYRYLSEVLTAFQEGATKLRQMQFSDEYLKEFLEGIRESKKNLAHYRESLFAKMDRVLGFMEKVRLIENQIHHMLGSLSNEYDS